MDRSRRATNPENYNPDGTFKRGVKLTRNKSKRYRRIQHQLAMIQHHQADIRKQQHNELANYLLTLGDCFFVENMSYCDLVHRANKTEISEKTGRYKRKKRFGKSIANKAPAMLITMLKQKCQSRGLKGVKEVDTLCAPASTTTRQTPASKRHLKTAGTLCRTANAYSAICTRRFYFSIASRDCRNIIGRN